MSNVVAGNFEWDSAKAAANLAKHGVSFEEAATAFADPNGYDAGDAAPQNSTEVRNAFIGFSIRARLLLVIETDGSKGRIRIISARVATGDEQRRYAAAAR